jgi:hypothetical protein
VSRRTASITAFSQATWNIGRIYAAAFRMPSGFLVAARRCSGGRPAFPPTGMRCTPVATCGAFKAGAWRSEPALSRGIREEAVSRSRNEIGCEPGPDIVGNHLGRAGLGVAQSAQTGEPLGLAGNVIGYTREGLPGDDDLARRDFG